MTAGRAGQVAVLQAGTGQLPLPRASAGLIVASPPCARHQPPVTHVLAASVLGRTRITIGQPPGYCRPAAWRTSDPRGRTRARAFQAGPPGTLGPAT